MNKKLKKLTLSRETLRDLEATRLKNVAGATGGTCIDCNTISIPDNSCAGTCQGTICDTCFTRLAQCTTGC